MGLDGGLFFLLLSFLCQQQLVIAFLHRVVLEKRLAQNALALWQEDFLVIFRNVPRGDERVARFADFGTDVDRERLQMAHGSAMCRRQLGEFRLARTANKRERQHDDEHRSYSAKLKGVHNVYRSVSFE